MTATAMRTHLTQVRPPQVASAYQLAKRYNIRQETARTILLECNYELTEDGWQARSTQLDRIESLLTELLNWVGPRVVSTYEVTPNFSPVGSYDNEG